MAGQREYPTGTQWDDTSFIANVKKRIARTKGATEKDVLATAIKFTNRAKAYAPRDTGFMAANIVWEEGRDAKGYFVVIYCRAFYWRFVEFGTRLMSAQPFMRPAWAEAYRFFSNRIVQKRNK